MRKVALITGVTGQDGAYLAELVAEMVRGDFKLAERDELVKSHGHWAYDYNE